MFCFVGFYFSIPVCRGLCLLLLKSYHSSCSGSSLPSFPSEPRKGRGEKGKQYYCSVRWIVALWSFTSRRGQATPPSEASLLKHPLLSQEWLFPWWQLKLLHGCGTDGNEITPLPGSAEFSLFPLLCTNRRGQLSPKAQCTLTGLEEGVLQGDAQSPELIPTPPTKLSIQRSKPSYP